MNINYQLIGKRIRDKRLEQSLSQETLSGSAGISTRSLSFIENGKTHVTVDSLYRIAYALGVTVDELIYGSVENVSVPYGSKLEEVFESSSSSERLFLFEVIRSIKAIMQEHGWRL